MAKKSKIVNCNKKKRKYLNAIIAWTKPKHSTKVYNRCKVCWRPHGYMWLFEMCRICFREMASKWQIPWVTKSSW